MLKKYEKYMNDLKIKIERVNNDIKNCDDKWIIAILEDIKKDYEQNLISIDKKLEKRGYYE